MSDAPIGAPQSVVHRFDPELGQFGYALAHALDHLGPPPDTPERFAAYIEHASREDQAVYVVRHDSCGGVVGYVSVGNIVRRAFQSAYLGYGGFEGHARQGLMGAGLWAVVDMAFGELGLHRVEANIQPANASSIGLVSRLGFEWEGFSPRYLLLRGAA